AGERQAPAQLPAPAAALQAQPRAPHRVPPQGDGRADRRALRPEVPAVRYWLCTLGALLLAGASIVLLDSGIYHLVRTGSCGSSSTYVSSRPCPPGTAGHILGLIGGVFGALIAVGIYAARGRRGGAGATIGLGLIVWSLMFVTIPGS